MGEMLRLVCNQSCVSKLISVARQAVECSRRQRSEVRWVGERRSHLLICLEPIVGTPVTADAFLDVDVPNRVAHLEQDSLYLSVANGLEQHPRSERSDL